MASELSIESSSNYWPGSYQPMGMRFRRSRTSRFALNTGINFLVRTAPALARVGPLRRVVLEHEPDPVDDNAQQALLDPEYAEGLFAYGEALEGLTRPIWEK
jgi:hypothetical protein